MALVGFVRRRAVACVLVLGLLAAPAWAQNAPPPGLFRVNWEPRDGGGVPTIQGHVHNDSPYRVTNVRLEVDAVDANGTLMARRDAWALGDILPGGDSTFVIERFEGAANYQMKVLSYSVVSVPAASTGPGARGPVEAP